MHDYRASEGTIIIEFDRHMSAWKICFSPNYINYFPIGAQNRIKRYKWFPRVMWAGYFGLGFFLFSLSDGASAWAPWGIRAWFVSLIAMAAAEDPFGRAAERWMKEEVIQVCLQDESFYREITRKRPEEEIPYACLAPPGGEPLVKVQRWTKS